MTKEELKKLNEKMEKLRAEARNEGMYKLQKCDKSKVIEFLATLPLRKTPKRFYHHGKELREKIASLHIPYNTFEIEPGLVFKFNYCESELVVIYKSEELGKKALEGCWEEYQGNF